MNRVENECHRLYRVSQHREGMILEKLIFLHTLYKSLDKNSIKGKETISKEINNYRVLADSPRLN